MTQPQWLRSQRLEKGCHILVYEYAEQIKAVPSENT